MDDQDSTLLAEETALGKRGKSRRKLAHLTQQQLAERCGVHPNTISDIERGKFNPGFLFGCRYAQQTNTNALYLAGLSDDPTEGPQLAPNEAELLAIYKRLNTDGRSTLLEIARDVGSLQEIARRGNDTGASLRRTG